MKKNGKALAAIIGIWLAAFLVCFVLIMFMGVLGTFSLLLAAGALFGAYKLSVRFNVDKIINKSSRKRILSFELATVSRIEKFNPAQISSVNAKELFITCNADDPAAYLMVSSTEGKGTSYLVFAPDERVRSAIVKFVPKFISNSAFK